jgi:hypothetical protein
MENSSMDALNVGVAETGFWQTVAVALAALARSAGCSASGCPLPEIREAARDLRAWSSASEL